MKLGLNYIGKLLLKVSSDGAMMIPHI